MTHSVSDWQLISPPAIPFHRYTAARSDWQATGNLSHWWNTIPLLPWRLLRWSKQRNWLFDESEPLLERVKHFHVIVFFIFSHEKQLSPGAVRSCVLVLSLRVKLNNHHRSHFLVPSGQNTIQHSLHGLVLHFNDPSVTCCGDIFVESDGLRPAKRGWFTKSMWMWGNSWRYRLVGAIRGHQPDCGL